MSTSSQSTLKCNGVPFVELTGELRYLARLSQKRRSRSESESEEGEKLGDVDPKPSDLPMTRLKAW